MLSAETRQASAQAQGIQVVVSPVRQTQSSIRTGTSGNSPNGSLSGSSSDSRDSSPSSSRENTPPEGRDLSARLGSMSIGSAIWDDRKEPIAEQKYDRVTDERMEEATEKATNKLGQYILDNDFTGFTAYIGTIEKAAQKSNASIASKMISTLLDKPITDKGATALHLASTALASIRTNKEHFIYYLGLKGANFNLLDGEGHSMCYRILKSTLKAQLLTAVGQVEAGVEKVQPEAIQLLHNEFHSAMRCAGLYIKFSGGVLNEASIATIETLQKNAPGKFPIEINQRTVLAACEAYLKSPAAVKIAAESKSGTGITL